MGATFARIALEAAGAKTQVAAYKEKKYARRATLQSMIMTGDKELDRALRRLEFDMQREIIVEALARAARPVAKRANELAPIDEDEETQPARMKDKHIKGGIHVWRPSAKALAKRRPGSPVLVRVRAPSRAALGIKKGSKGFYPSHVELGHVHGASGRHVPARPFMRPALYERAEQVKALARRFIWKGIQKSVRTSKARGAA